MQTVSDITAFVSAIHKFNSILERNHMDKQEVLLFRGQSNTEHQLLPTIARNRLFTTDNTIFNQERNLIEMAKYKIPEISKAECQPIELLALLQHHGIPTRLLDITENALVALYFACSSNPDMDGEVFVFKNNETDIVNYPIVNAIADSYRFVRGSFYDLSLFYQSVKNQPYFLEQRQIIETCFETDKMGGKWISDCCAKPLFVYAPIKSLRQRAQQGRYILFPNRIEHVKSEKDDYFTALIDSIPKEHSCIISRLTIPHESKKQLLADLRILGVSKETLFGDNIDIVCESIVDMFSPD